MIGRHPAIPMTLAIWAIGAIASSAAGAHGAFPFSFFEFDEQSRDAATPLTEDTDGVRLFTDRAGLATLRVQGVPGTMPDPATTAPIEIPLQAPELDASIARWFERGAGGALTIDPPPFDAVPLDTGSIGFRMDRNTSLTDGGIKTGTGVLGSGPAVASLTQGEGEYTLTDLEMHWRAGSGGPLELRLVSGVTTIEADVRSRTSGNDMHEVHSRVVPVPTFGSAVRWEISDGWSITSKAQTQSIDLGSSFLDFSARSDWRLGDRVDLSAGYQIIRSSFEVDSLSSDLTQEGLFARVQIKF